MLIKGLNDTEPALRDLASILRRIKPDAVHITMPNRPPAESWVESPDALIEVLHTAQELFGYLAPDLLLSIARSLRLPPSRVYGVATFYHFFSLQPKGKYTCVVCLGTPCYVNGAAGLLAAVEQYAGLQAGETTPDAGLSLQKVRCIGACGMAPLVILDGTVTGHQTAEAVLEQMKGWKDGSR